MYQRWLGLLVAVGLPVAGVAQDSVPLAYRSDAGKWMETTVTSGVLPDGSVAVPAYKGADGVFHRTTVMVQACGLDASGKALACPAATDATGTMVAPINSALAHVGVLSAGATVGGQFVPSAQFGVDPAPDMFRGYETALLGGLPLSVPGTNVNGLPQQLNVQADPYGPFNMGCGLCLMTGADYTDRAGISGQDPRGGASALVGMGGFDLVGFYEGATNQPARMVLSVASYTAQSAVLARPLTAAQQALIHPGMYLVTNSNSVSAQPVAVNGQLPVKMMYAGIVSSVSSDGGTINVYAWDVPGGGTGQSGQVPAVDRAHLDTYWSGYGTPVLFVGQGTKMFARNVFMTYDGTRSQADGNTQSLIHAMEGEEMDMFVSNESRPNSVSLHGITITPLMSNAPTSVLTSDSYDLNLSGVMPNHLLIDEGANDNVIKANSFLVRGNAGSSTNDPDVVMSELDAFADGANDMRIVTHMARENEGANGWLSAVLHIGLVVDGAQGSLGGSREADIEFDHGGQYGGIALCGYAANCGLSVGGGGAVTISDGLTMTSPLTLAGQGLFATGSAGQATAQLYPTEQGDWVVGTQVGGGANIRGVNGLYGGSATMSGLVSAAGGVVVGAMTFGAAPGGPSVGQVFFCSDCYSTARASGSHATGLLASWNGANWVDGVGNPVLH